MLPGLIGISGVRQSHNKSAFSASFYEWAFDTSNASTYTVVGQGIGSEDDDRYVVVAVSNVTTGSLPVPTVNSVVVGGCSCTKVVEQTAATLGQTRLSMWITDSPVPYGTVANIVVTASGVCAGIGLATFPLINPSGPTAYDTGSSVADDAFTVSATLDFPSGGCVIAAAVFDQGFAGNVTWSGATEQFSSNNGNGNDFSGALSTGLSAASNQTVSATWGDAAPGVIVAATWRP